MLHQKTRRILNRARALVLVLRHVVKHYGADKLHPQDIRLIRDVLHLHVRRRKMTPVALPGHAPVGRARTLLLRSGLNPFCDAFHVLQEALRQITPFGKTKAARDEARAVIDLVVLCGLLGDSVAGACTDDEIDALCEPLWEVDPQGWYDQQLPRLLRWRKRLHASLPRPLTSSSAAAPPPACLALAAGREARESARFRTALRLFRVAAVNAADTGDWDTFSRAYGGAGRVFHARGNFPKARHFGRVAARVARTHGSREAYAFALHDLTTYAINSHQVAEANRLARLTFEAYPAGHPRTAILLHDIAVSWLEQGYHHRALVVIEAFLASVTSLDQRMIALGNVVRAAAGARHDEAFNRAWREVWELLETHPDGWGVAQTLFHLGQGCSCRGEKEAAERLFERASAVARMRRESHIRVASDAALASLSSAPDAPRTAPPAQHAVEEFAQEIVLLYSWPAESSVAIA